MNPIVLRCSSCRARIKAPAQLRGQTRNCPGCGTLLIIQPQRLEDSGPVLVYENYLATTSFMPNS